MKMKTGDPKQAIILAVVAIGAIGFLIKTSVSSFGGKISNAPMVVKDLKGGDSDAPADPAKANTAKVATKANEDQPAKSDETPTFETSRSTISPIRDAFITPANLNQIQRMPGNVQNPERITHTGNDSDEVPPKDPGEFERSGPLPKQKPGTGNSSEPSQGEGDAKDQANGSKGHTIRLSGFVKIGKSTAIFDLDGSTLSVAIGEAVESGYLLQSVSEDKAVLQRGKNTIVLHMGREVEIK